jgi:hypothetical protein
MYMIIRLSDITMSIYGLSMFRKISKNEGTMKKVCF